MRIETLVKEAIERQASDIFITAGAPIAYKILNHVVFSEGNRLTPKDTWGVVEELYQLADKRSIDRLKTHGDDDFSFSLAHLARLRVSIYQQRSSYAVVVRLVSHEIPEADAMHIPTLVTDLVKLEKGLVIVSGPAGSGKSTTLAILLDWINRMKAHHIVTIEDPIEFLHTHQKSIVSQRELGSDAFSAASALKAALRQAPNVLFISEMRDLETIALAITAAETGHLVFSTLHTLGACNTIDRMIDVFPAAQQSQIRLQLSMVLQAVVSQQLVRTKDATLYPVFEVMRSNLAIRSQIREAKTHQLSLSIETSKEEGMISLNQALLDLIKKDLITHDEARLHTYDKAGLEQLLK